MVKQGAGFGEVNSPLHFLQALRAVAADFGARNRDFHFEGVGRWLCQVRRIRCKLHKAKGRTRFGI